MAARPFSKSVGRCLAPTNHICRLNEYDSLDVPKEELNVCPPCGAGGRWLKALSLLNC